MKHECLLKNLKNPCCLYKGYYPKVLIEIGHKLTPLSTPTVFRNRYARPLSNYNLVFLLNFFTKAGATRFYK